MMCFLKKLFGSSCSDDDKDKKDDENSNPETETNLNDQVSPESEFSSETENPIEDANEELKKEMSEDNQ